MKMEEKVYWKGIEELIDNNSNAADKEFAEELPIINAVTEPISIKATTNRRDFLKMLGFSVSAAVVAASCEMPVRKSIPYAIKPEEVTPGVANYYASTMFYGGEVLPVLVKTREGRPIKIEGNKSAYTKGGTSARAQASVLSLYDGMRYGSPKQGKDSLAWDKADESILTKLNTIKSSGGKIVVYSATIPSPATQAAINEFCTAFGASHLVHDAVSYDGMLSANERNFGKRTIPSYNLEKADLIVSFGADFLGTWLSPVEFAADYGKRRKIGKGNTNMNKHIQVESILTISGASADKRYVVKLNEEAALLAELFTVISGGSSTNAKVNAIAKELKANAGKSVVLSGSNDSKVQEVANAINAALGNYGNTISFANSYNTKAGSDKSAKELVDGLTSGAIKGVVFYQSNPVQTLPFGDKLAEAIKKADLSVSLSEKADETSSVCQFVCPDNHWLESWNDFAPKNGVYNTSQPTIYRLFNTRQAGESFLTWAGKKTSFEDYVRASAATHTSKMWQIQLQDGESTTAGGAEASFSGNGASAAAEVAAKYSKGGQLLKLYASIPVGDGTWADNPFLQELPDPITKVCWDNYVMVPISWVVSKKITNDLEMKEYQLVKVTANGKSVELPAVGVPGLAEDSFAIALGYGKTTVLHDEMNIGKNVYGLVNTADGEFNYTVNATVEPIAKTAKLAITQTHHNITLKGLGGIKKRKIVKETTLDEYVKNPYAGNEDRAEILEHMVTLYYEHEKPGHHWTMAIDLNSCIGCGACVTACNIENNVPVVGKDQVVRSREMHWMRIDRYFTYNEMIEGGANTLDPEKLDVVFQPLMCQHCDNAPCENVCPVAATNHSSEGLNQMAYNRCIGTRYCANNCPYKVRRFNWYDYQVADAFDASVGTIWANEDKLSEVTRELHEPLTRLVLNPDVTVRSRGVIEKCSFCVQRLQEAKLTAKKQNRPLKDGDAITACATACPTNAITFGDRNDKSSMVAADYADSRTFGVIEEIHTMPNVLYKTKVRNRKADNKA